MKEYWNTNEYQVIKENILPSAIKFSSNIKQPLSLLNPKAACVSFSSSDCASFEGKNAYLVLDFGREICGGIRLLTRIAKNTTKFRITFGESLSEALSDIGEKNATNDHSPRDFTTSISSMSDLTIGQTGFRFVRIELLDDTVVLIKNIYAVNTLPCFEKEASIITSDEALNKIINTASYTLKLCFQNGYIWDGIKRDRLVWAGDLHQEIINSLYLFGDNQNVVNSLTFLKEETSSEDWINNIPSYSVWWIINLCDYYKLSGNHTFFIQNKDYAKAVFLHLDDCITSSGQMTFETPSHELSFFLDWPTYGTKDALIGTAMLIIIAAKAYLQFEDYETCHKLIHKLSCYLNSPCESKQTLAFQILAGKTASEDISFFEKDGASGFSTFMAYYILTAYAKIGGTKSLDLIKEYFGGMLSRGATTFWEDFDIKWLENSCSIDELPKEGQKNIHSDFGAYCYQKLRHSLCHGWSSGVLSFIIEYIIGLKITENAKGYELNPHPLGIRYISAKFPLKEGWLELGIQDEKLTKSQLIKY